MLNSQSKISDIILQSLAFLAKDNADDHPYTGLVIADTTDKLATQANTQLATVNINWQVITPEQLKEQSYEKRYDLAVLFLSQQAFINTNNIQRCRDLFAKHCLVIESLSPKNEANVDMVSFGFSRLTEQPIIEKIDEVAYSYQVWQFNLFDYKHLPDWFNSKFWANPELWDKFRW